jgi:hypothetical protein
VSAHEAAGKSDEWYTPPEVFEAIGLRFDLDVASPGSDVVPWVPADAHLTEFSLLLTWVGRIWMNPPFGKRNGYAPWADRFVAHGNGIALAPDRTSAPWFQDFAQKVDGLLFWSPKIKFIKPDGTRGESPGTGTTLLSMGAECTEALARLHGVNGIFCTPGRVMTHPTLKNKQGVYC